MTTTPEQSAQPASLIHPTVLSFDADSAVVEGTLTVVKVMREDGATVEEAAVEAAGFLADQVAAFRGVTDWYCTNRERAEQESAEIEACNERQNVRFQRMERSEATS